MDKYEIPFLTLCIRAFAERFELTRQEAFRYLHKYKGLEFLIEFYDVEHLQSIEETIDDLIIICQKNGGENIAEMTKEERDDYSRKIAEGIRLAEKKFYQERAKNGEYVVIADKDGVIKRVLASDIIAEHPELQE